MLRREKILLLSALAFVSASAFASQSPNFTAQLTGKNGDLLIKVFNLPVFNTFIGTSITDKATGTAVTNFFVTVTNSSGVSTVISTNANLSFAYKVSNKKGVATDKGKAFTITSDDSKTQMVFKVDVSAAITSGAISSVQHGKSSHSSKPSLANLTSLSITFSDSSLTKTFKGTPDKTGKVHGGP